MMTCQVTNPMVPMSDMTVRYESLTDLAQEREKSKVSRLPFILPSTMKSVEVESLNRVYKGMGIRNVNGGMVFYSDNIHDKRKSTYEDSLMSLREQLEQLAHERALTIATIANGRKNIHKWNSLIEEKHHALLSNEAVMRDLISQQRIGLITEEEKTERRKAIFSDNRRIENEIQRVEQLTVGEATVHLPLHGPASLPEVLTGQPLQFPDQLILLIVRNALCIQHAVDQKMQLAVHDLFLKIEAAANRLFFHLTCITAVHQPCLLTPLDIHAHVNEIHDISLDGFTVHNQIILVFQKLLDLLLAEAVILIRISPENIQNIKHYHFLRLLRIHFHILLLFSVQV